MNTLTRGPSRLLLLGALTAGSAGCTEVGQSAAHADLYVAGQDVSAPVLAAGEVPVQIDRADLAFGPLYLCAGTSAGDLCATARLEWLESALIDAADPQRQYAGALVGVSGPVRSWMYDLGLSSQLTQAQPFVSEAARALGGASFVLEGRATVAELTLPFRAAVVVSQSEETEHGVPVVRKSSHDAFSHEVPASGAGLLVRFNPAAWVRGIDFRAYVTHERCTLGGPEQVCDGGLALRCEGEEVRARQDCAALGQVCVRGEGCQRWLEIEEGSQAHRHLRNAMVSGERATFQWVEDR